MQQKLCNSPAFMMSCPPLFLLTCVPFHLLQQELPRYGSSVLLSLNFRPVDPVVEGCLWHHQDVGILAGSARFDRRCSCGWSTAAVGIRMEHNCVCQSSNNTSVLKPCIRGQALCSVRLGACLRCWPQKAKIDGMKEKIQ